MRRRVFSPTRVAAAAAAYGFLFCWLLCLPIATTEGFLVGSAAAPAPAFQARSTRTAGIDGARTKPAKAARRRVETTKTATGGPANLFRMPPPPPSLFASGDESGNAERPSGLRRGMLSLLLAFATASAAGGGGGQLADTTLSLLMSPPPAANAAPPMAVIAEELGYFPVTNRDGKTVMVPKRVSRESSRQATELARRLRDKGVVMVGTYWCPHTSRQKELLGREAFEQLKYVECSPKGYNGNPSYCISKRVDGYPAWVFTKDGDETLSGERSLAELAEKVGYSGFDPSLEKNVPPLLGMGSCKKS